MNMNMNMSSIKTASNGVWQGDNPLHFAFPLLILQSVLILLLTRFLALLLKPLRQPKVIAEIVVSSLFPSLVSSLIPYNFPSFTQFSNFRAGFYWVHPLSGVTKLIYTMFSLHGVLPFWNPSQVLVYCFSSSSLDSNSISPPSVVAVDELSELP